VPTGDAPHRRDPAPELGLSTLTGFCQDAGKAADRGSWLVQGSVVTDPEALAETDIREGESVVEIPDRMIQFSTEEGPWRHWMRLSSIACYAASSGRQTTWRCATPNGTEVELPYMAIWAAQNPDDLTWLDDWCATLRSHVAAQARVFVRRGSSPSR
jgi:hypothetical protein